MPVGRHLDLSFTTDADHVQATLLAWVAGDDGHFNAGDERLPDQLAWRDDGVALRECQHRHEKDRHGENRARDSDRKSTRLNSSHSQISYAVFCLKKKKKQKCARTR